MARDVTDDNFYVVSGGKIPAKWTAPEVYITCIELFCYCLANVLWRVAMYVNTVTKYTHNFITYI